MEKVPIKNYCVIRARIIRIGIELPPPGGQPFIDLIREHRNESGIMTHDKRMADNRGRSYNQIGQSDDDNMPICEILVPYFLRRGFSHSYTQRTYT